MKTICMKTICMKIQNKQVKHATRQTVTFNTKRKAKKKKLENYYKFILFIGFLS